MQKRIVKTLILTVLAAAALSVSAFAANLGGGTVSASALNMRSEANTESQIKTVAPRGAAIIVKEQVGDSWYKVYYRGAEGYMAAQYIAFADTLDGSFGYGTIQGSTVRLRDAASYESNTRGYYNSGTQMPITGVSGEWYRVDYEGAVGYVHSDYMTLSTSNASTGDDGGDNTGDSGIGGEADTSVGAAIIETAKKYLGVPYVWGGTSTSGFDCSGFVYYVYKEHGYSINRTAATICDNDGYNVDKSELQPGDVVCFTSSGGGYIGHVGMYVGDGQFIHASSGQGKVVITALDSSYYLRVYSTAKRIV